MKKIFFVICIILSLYSCSKGNPYKLKGGYAITLQGDTLRFYGGTITYFTTGISSRDINRIVLEEDSIFYNKK